MTLMISGMLTGEFGNSVDERTRQRILWHLREQEERIENLNPGSERNQDKNASVDISITLATSDQLLEFKLELDELRLETTEALILQERLIEAARERISIVLDEAHNLEDGRKVFKTRDGDKVFDSEGNEIDAEIVSPESIPDHKPRFEDYWEQRIQLEALEKEQADLLELEQKLDELDERIANGSLTAEELDELGSELPASMPEKLLGRQAGLENTRPANLSSTHETPSAPNLDRELSGLAVPKLG